MAAYEMTALREELIVKKIVTVHYFEFEKNYVFIGEKHDFWELVYVDKGEADIVQGTRWSRLRQGELAFHQPGEFHNLRANGEVAPNIVIVAFDCRSRAMRFFRDKIVTLRDEEKHLLADVVKEAGRAFVSPLGDPFLLKMERASENIPFGCEQMIKLSLERLLISLYRSNTLRPVSRSILKQHMERDLVENVIDFLNDNLGGTLTFGQVADFAKVSRTGLKEAFREKMGMGVMAYYIRLKVERAKSLIREDTYNFTQIAALLGYDSIHHFSRQFRQVTGMSPTEYARSVKIEFDDMAFNDSEKLL